MFRKLAWLVALSTPALAAGCSGSSTETTGSLSAALRRTMTCEELDSALKSDAIDKMNAVIDANIRAIDRYGVRGYYGYGYADGAAGPPRASGVNAGAEQGGAGAFDSNGAQASSAKSYSETNTQVAGVDEADIVKTDGKRIFVLHGSALLINEAWPAESLATKGAAVIEGYPSEMYLAGDRVVVYSSVDGKPIYEGAGVAPRTHYRDYDMSGGGFSTGIAAADVREPGTSPPNGGVYYPQLSKITVLKLAGDSASVERELYFEGSYLDSRRVDQKVRTVLSGGDHGPELQYWPVFENTSTSGTTTQTAADYKAALESVRRKNIATIQATKVQDWMPYQFVREGGSITAKTPECSSYYVPTKATSRYGLTQIHSIDLAAPGNAPSTTAIVSQADTVYSNKATMLLAARAWTRPEPWFFGGGVAETDAVGAAESSDGTAPPAETGTASPTPQSVRPKTTIVQPQVPITMNWTHLHAFSLDADPTVVVYTGSGTVPGTVNDQFSLEEKAGVVRVSTTEDRTTVDDNGRRSSSERYNHVYALEHKADGLAKIGDVGDLAKGERIYSTRYVGDKAYVVTFRQVDPLFVIDMANPRDLKLLGELKIPGFSNYMHPLDDTHLLTIGRDNGLALQIFDVSDPAHPKLAHKFDYQNNSGYSEAQQDHKAFTYFADQKTLAFPFYGYDGNGMTSTLELFKIDTATGFQKLGSVDHSTLVASAPRTGYCGGRYSPHVRRGVFFEDVVFAISYGGMTAHKLSDLQTPLAELPFPVPGEGRPECGGGGVPVSSGDAL